MSPWRRHFAFRDRARTSGITKRAIIAPASFPSLKQQVAATSGIHTWHTSQEWRGCRRNFDGTAAGETDSRADGGGVGAKPAKRRDLNCQRTTRRGACQTRGEDPPAVAPDGLPVFLGRIIPLTRIADALLHLRTAKDERILPGMSGLRDQEDDFDHKSCRATQSHAASVWERAITGTKARSLTKMCGAIRSATSSPGLIVHENGAPQGDARKSRIGPHQT